MKEERKNQWTIMDMAITNIFHPLTISHHTQWPTNLLGIPLTKYQIQRVVLPVKVDLVDPQHLQYYHYNVQDTPSNQRPPKQNRARNTQETKNNVIFIILLPNFYLSLSFVYYVILCTPPNYLKKIELNTTVPT